MVKYYKTEKECLDNVKDNLLEKKGNNFFYKNEPIESFLDFEESTVLIKSIKAYNGKDNAYSYIIDIKGDFLKKVKFDTRNIDTIELKIGTARSLIWPINSSNDFCFVKAGIHLLSLSCHPVYFIVKYKKYVDIVPDIKAHYLYYGANDRKLLIQSKIFDRLYEKL